MILVGKHAHIQSGGQCLASAARICCHNRLAVLQQLQYSFLATTILLIRRVLLLRISIAVNRAANTRQHGSPSTPIARATSTSPGSTKHRNSFKPSTPLHSGHFFAQNKRVFINTSRHTANDVRGLFITPDKSGWLFITPDKFRLRREEFEVYITAKTHCHHSSTCKV